MANKTLSENINQAINDFKGVKQAIIDKGVEIPSGTPTSEYGTKISEIQSGGGLDTSQFTDFMYFCQKNRLNNQLDKLDTSNGTVFHSMFIACTNLTTVPSLNTSKGTSFEGMFQKCSSLTSIPTLNTSEGTSFNQMFQECSSLTTVPKLDTSKGTSFDYMFSGCSSLTTVPLLNLKKGTTLSHMFQGCSKLTSYYQSDMWDYVSDYSYMFHSCSKLKSVTLNTRGLSSSVNANKVNYSYMFYNCSSLTSFGGSYQGDKNRSCSYMFYGCTALTTMKLPLLDAYGSFSSMFYGCENLKTISLGGFVTSNNMFYGCSALESLTAGKIIVSNNYLNLSGSPLLTVDSLLDIFDALEDNTGKTTYKITLGSTNLAKLTDEQKAIATNKNYTLV